MGAVLIMAQSSRFLSLVVLAWMTFACNEAFAQTEAGGRCKPVSQRTEQVGCWILDDQPIGQLKKSSVFWHLDTYQSRAAAETDRGPRGVVIESLDKVWLLTIEDEGWRPTHGTRVAEIGPLPIANGEKYSAQYMEAIFTPGMTSHVHMHSGPEAWFTIQGETCLESSDGRVQFGRAGSQAVVVPGGLSMHLTATGKEQRRALVLILHESSKPATIQVHDWSPKGLCKLETESLR
jgi:quercetin dioxygenase-like cupin family protein